VRHLRIAGAEDSIAIHVDIDFLLHGRLYIDFGEDAEAVCSQRRAGSAVDFFNVGTVDQAVDGVAHSGFLSGCQV